MFLLKKLLTALVLPPAGPLLLALLGAWWWRRARGGRRLANFGFGLLVVSLVGLLALSIPAVGQALLRQLETVPPLDPASLGAAQAIVVLGGGIRHQAVEFGGDTVSAASLERIRYAARLYRLRRLPVLVSAGAPSGGVPEAQAMRETLGQELGVPVRWTESASRDTAENARFSAAILRREGIDTVLLVSHAWHLPRAMALFRAEGLNVVPAPTGFTTPAAVGWMNWLPGDLRAARLAAHEALGRLVDRLRSGS